jgi:hypothetical protein
MADHKYVQLALEWLRNEWSSTNYPGGDGQVPAFVDGDDGSAETYEGRKIKYDLKDNNAVIVSSSPDRQQTPTGDAWGYRYEDAIAITVAGLHTDKFGHITDPSDFRALYQETRRVINDHQEYPDPEPDHGYALGLGIFDESNLSSRYLDLFEYSITATVNGYEQL